MDLLRFALVRITLFLISGIVFSHYFHIDLWIWLTASPVMMLIVSCWQFIRPKGRSVGMTALLLSVAFSVGGLSESFHNQLASDHFIRKFSGEDSSKLTVLLSERLRTGAKGRRFVAEVESVDAMKSSGKVLLQLPPGKDYAIGTRMEVIGAFVTHRSALNPGQFDYGAYLTNKGILAKCYPKTIRLLQYHKKDLWFYADALRKRLTSNLRAAGFPEVELQVFSALLLGQQQDIDTATMKDYQFSGAVHILSVSGLHVGFVVVLLQFLLKPIPKHRSGSFLRLSITIFFLWGFALVAGLSPSVVRSATMFSFLAVGMHLRRENNSFHTLMVSLMVLLLIDPSYLFDVGFQLSYAALAAIFWLQPIATKFWEPKPKIVRYFWDIITVSTAAQLGTLPLSLYYFHQFPGLFLATNLVVIPMLAVIMTLGLVVLFMALLNWLPSIAIDVCSGSIRWLNTFMRFVASFDDWVWQGIPFHLIVIPIAYLLLIVWFRWLWRPQVHRLIIAGAFTLLLQIGWICWRKIASTEAEFIVLQSRQTMLGIRQHNHIDWFGAKIDSAAKTNYMTEHYALQSAEVNLKNTLAFGEKRILILDSSGVVPTNLKPDLLIVSGSPKVNPSRILLQCNPEVLIVDGSNSGWHSMLWRRAARKQKIPFHSTYEKGSFSLKKRLLLP